MSQAATLVQRPASHWIVSPAWDLAFIVASPLAIIPLVWIATRDLLTPEQLLLPVLAFATLGHHLPGYMRAYGDRELFARFRWRFTLAPPVLFVTVLVFAWPQLYGVKHLPLHGLELIALLWSTWHGLMQIYGFMRMYDRKRGIDEGWTPRLDLVLCATIFAAGTLFSDSRVYAIMDAIWKAGVPTFGPEWLTLARALAAVWVALVAIVYLVNFLRSDQRGAVGAWAKLAVAVSTGFIYWFAGRLSTNILVGVAIFEIFHAIQYFAIVWVFNRRKRDRVGRDFGWLGFLFRDSWATLALYLLAIATFGSCYFLLGDLSRYSAGLDYSLGGNLETVLLAIFVTSNLLHYYYDGFIWKFRAKKSPAERAAPSRFDSAGPLAHLGKWSIFYVAAAGLFLLELSRPVTTEAHFERLRVLAAWTPSLPEIQGRLIRDDLERGDAASALGRAQHASSLRPRSSGVQADLAAALSASGRPAAAEAALGRALELQPDSAPLQLELGNLYLGRHRPGDLERAIAAYAAGLELQPRSERLRHRMVSALLGNGQTRRAVAVARQGYGVRPDSGRIQLALGRALNEAGQHAEALPLLERAWAVLPELAEAAVELGVARGAAGDLLAAQISFESAIALDPGFSSAHYQLGLVLDELAAPEAAVTAYREFALNAPHPAAGFRKLAQLLLKEKKLERAGAARAEWAYREALSLEPGHARTHYNLGSLLYVQGRIEEGRMALLEARSLGYESASLDRMLQSR